VKIILAYTGPSEREQDARDLLHDAGIKLDSRRAYQLTLGKDPADLDLRLSRGLPAIAAKSTKGDLVYADYEPPEYNHPKEFDSDIASATIHALNATKLGIPSDRKVSVYGFPYNRWWHAHTTQTALFGFRYTHRQTPMGWFGPQFYQPYNINDKNGINNLHRILQIKNVCNWCDPSVPVIPFIQPVIRHKDNDYAEMTDETISDVWSSLAWAGIEEVVWWFEGGRDGQLIEGHRERIKRQAPIIEEALASVVPENE